MRNLLKSAFAAMAAVLAFVVAAPAAASQAPPPRSDEGMLVYSVSTLGIAMNFTFEYRRIGLPSGEPVQDRPRLIECRCVGFFRAQMANPDYTGRDTGKVFVTRLPAGRYEVFDFGFGGSLAGRGTSWSSRTRFSMPFTIRPGEATYIGNFARAPSLGTPLEAQLGAAGFFVISDKSERDFPIARSREASLGDIRKDITDVSQFSHAALRTSEP